MTSPSTQRNLITDVAGILVGNAHDEALASGVTTVLPDPNTVTKFTAAVDIRGGGPATRDCDPLALASTVEECHGLVFSGGSGYGLGAADAVQAHLRAANVGLSIADQIVPIVPQAILFDLANGGNKNWGTTPPYPALAATAAKSASTQFDIGSAGAGFGATTADLRGGLGSASTRRDTVTVGAIAAVNALGSVLVPGTSHFWAAGYEIGDEFGGRGLPSAFDPAALAPLKSAPPTAQPKIKTPSSNTSPSNTTLCTIATDATLTKVQCHRLAIMAHAGLTQAIRPAHTPFDGDLVFALSTGVGPAITSAADLTRLGQMAAMTLARAIARGVYAATTTPSDLTMPPAYRDAHPA